MTESRNTCLRLFISAIVAVNMVLSGLLRRKLKKGLEETIDSAFNVWVQPNEQHTSFACYCIHARRGIRNRGKG